MFPDCAFAAIGDAGMVADQRWLDSPRQYSLIVEPNGLGMLHGLAQCDDLPVEVGRLGSEIVAARLEFTSDVAEVEAKGKGSWTPLGRLRIGRGGAIAVDMKMRHLSGWLHRLPLAMGWYRAEVFLMPRMHLGIRLVAEKIPAGQGGG